MESKQFGCLAVQGLLLFAGVASLQKKQMVPWYGPLIRNPYRYNTIINHEQNNGPYFRAFLEGKGHTRGP